MRVLITGNMGYVGSVLVRYLRENYPDADLVGFDIGLFAHAVTGLERLPETYLSAQIFGDVRKLDNHFLQGFDAVIHLAAISNDPMGKEFELVTEDINRKASVSLAKAAAAAGVKHFVFASSCSMYGASAGAPRSEEDPTNPLTAYAESKIRAENDLKHVDLGEMIFTSLRFATACGMSDRLRLDLVLNDFVACAITSKKITVLSDGTPWRPLIDVLDMARAVDWAISRDASRGGKWLVVNAGRNSNNYRVGDLAEAVQRSLPDTTISINSSAPSDNRSYKVNFSLFESLAPKHLPQMTLDLTISRLANGLRGMNFTDSNFRGSSLMRLNMLRQHISAGRLNRELQWGIGGKPQR